MKAEHHTRAKSAAVRENRLNESMWDIRMAKNIYILTMNQQTLTARLLFVFCWMQ